MTDPARTASRPSPLPLPWAWLAVATAASIPLVDLGLERLKIPFLPKRPLNLTLFDPLVWIAAASLIAILAVSPERRQTLRQLGRRWLACIWPALLLFAVAIASLLHMPQLEGKTLGLAGKTLIQWTEYLLLLPLVLLPLLADPLWRRRVFWGLCLTTIAAIASVAWRSPLHRVFAGEIHPYLVGGLLGNRNTYGIFMAMALCLLAAWAHGEMTATPAGVRRSPWHLAPAILLPILAVYPWLAAGPLVGFLAGLAITCGAGRRAGVLIVFVLVAVILCIDGGGDREKRLRELTRSLQTFRPQREPGAIMETPQPTMRAYRWSANLNLIAQNPLLGVGCGQYQRHINLYYGDLSYPSGRTDIIEYYDLKANEPFTFSWYFVTAGETGLLGFAALLAFLGAIAARALGSASQPPCLAAAGVLGAVVALLIAALWTSPMTRGAGPLLGWLLATSATGPDAPGVAQESGAASEPLELTAAPTKETA